MRRGEGLLLREFMIGKQQRDFLDIWKLFFDKRKERIFKGAKF